MSDSKVCRVLSELGDDDEYRALKAEFIAESEGSPKGDPNSAYKRVLLGVLEVLADCADPDCDVKLNPACLVLIEDIATNGRCRFPWKVVKMLVLVVYTRLLDELHEAGGGRPEEPAAAKAEEELKRLKRECAVYILAFDLPPFTLQRLCEIPLVQPYRSGRKLFNAYRKLFAVRAIDYNPVALPPALDLAEFAPLERVYANLAAWERSYREGLHAEWDEDLLSERSDDSDSADFRPLKRPLAE